MKNHTLKCVLISDFNLENLNALLNYDEDPPLLNATLAPYGQVFQILMNKAAECWQDNADFAIIWTRPDGIIESFNRLTCFESISLGRVLDEVDLFSEKVIEILDCVNMIFVPTWSFPSYYRGYGMLDMKKDLGIRNVLCHMNLRLSENFENSKNIFLLDSEKWIGMIAKPAFNPKLWYMAKIPFVNEVFKLAARDIKAALLGLSGKSKKLIILDLDNTLWGGIVGDDGWNNLVLGGHDPTGEAFVDFQKALKALMRRGIVLSIVSKNEEAIALEAISNHPEMILKMDDFAGWRINWRDKAHNILELVKDLNLGLRSVVFIDDNPVERARVREALPEVYVPELPEDKLLYKSFLLNLPVFDSPSISQEDKERTKMYVSERKRTELREELGSFDDWLKTLEVVVKVEKINDANLKRTIQLLNKTNQMNLRTRRLTENEFSEWINAKGHELWTFRVEDKFGDSGLTGIISIEIEGNNGQIVDFVLSCRVMGRKIEETMIHVASEYARSMGLKALLAHYMPTDRNRPCLEFLKNSGSNNNHNEETFTYDLSQDYPLPPSVRLLKDDEALV